MQLGQLQQFFISRATVILPISEVKPCLAGLVLGWMTARKLHVACGV